MPKNIAGQTFAQQHEPVGANFFQLWGTYEIFGGQGTGQEHRIRIDVIIQDGIAIRSDGVTTGKTAVRLPPCSSVFFLPAYSSPVGAWVGEACR